ITFMNQICAVHYIRRNDDTYLYKLLIGSCVFTGLPCIVTRCSQARYSLCCVAIVRDKRRGNSLTLRFREGETKWLLSLMALPAYPPPSRPQRLGRAKTAVPRKSWFARFLDAMIEARMEQARREIRMHTRLL